MRFNLFGFKGNLQTYGGDDKKEKRKSTKDDGSNLVVCTGYRPYVAFDERPTTPVPVRSNQASTSNAARNGAVPKTKASKENVTIDKKKEQSKPVDKVKEQKQPADKNKEPKVKEQKVAEKSKEQKAKDAKNKATKSVDKSKDKNGVKPAQNKDSKDQKVKAEKVKEPKQKDNKEKDKGKTTVYAQNSKSVNSKASSKKSKSPSIPVTQKVAVTQATNPAMNLHVAKSKSTESIGNKSIRQEDDDSETDTGGFLTVVSGKTKSIAVPADDNDKSTLLFMTEDHEDEDELMDISRFRGRSNDQDKEQDKARSNYSNDYSNHAASIFFSGSEPEPAQRTRKVQYRNDDDDDNGSQTSV